MFALVKKWHSRKVALDEPSSGSHVGQILCSFTDRSHQRKSMLRPPGDCRLTLPTPPPTACPARISPAAGRTLRLLQRHVLYVSLGVADREPNGQLYETAVHRPSTRTAEMVSLLLLSLFPQHAGVAIVALARNLIIPPSVHSCSRLEGTLRDSPQVSVLKQDFHWRRQTRSARRRSRTAVPAVRGNRPSAAYAATPTARHAVPVRPAWRCGE